MISPTPDHGGNQISERCAADEGRRITRTGALSRPSRDAPGRAARCVGAPGCGTLRRSAARTCGSAKSCALHSPHALPTARIPRGVRISSAASASHSFRAVGSRRRSLAARRARVS